jgi:hypothetical protein
VAHTPEDEERSDPENGCSAAIAKKVSNGCPTSADQFGQRSTLQPDPPNHITQVEQFREDDRKVKGNQ